MGWMTRDMQWGSMPKHSQASSGETRMSPITSGAPEGFWGSSDKSNLGLERERGDCTRGLFTEAGTPRMKQIPPHPHAAAMGFKAPAGKKLSGAGSGDRKEPNGNRDHVMALPAWGGLPKEIVDQNLAKSTRFSQPPPLSRGERDAGRLSQKDAQVQSLWIFRWFNLCGRRHVQR